MRFQPTLFQTTFFLFAFAIGAVSCGDDNGSVEAPGMAVPTTAATSTGAPGSTPLPSASASPATTVAVSIPAGAMNLGTSAFAPNPVTISAGTTVTWTNNDTIAHTVTSDTNVFDSGLLAPGQTFSHTFDAAGSFPYFCQPHPSMRGTVEVTAGGAQPSGTPSPNPTST